MKKFVMCFLIMLNSVSFAETSYYQKENGFMDFESSGLEKQSHEVDTSDVDTSNLNQNPFPYITPMQSIRLSIVLLFIGTFSYLAYHDYTHGLCFIRRS